MSQVLVVEDEAAIAELIALNLRHAGYEVKLADTADAAQAAVDRVLPDLVLLDWMLPDLDGLTVCRRIRERHVMPVIMLTARTDEIDRVMGLEVGADDYVTKPFSMRELLARVRANLRRVELDGRPAGGKAVAADGETIKLGGLVVEPEAHAASVDGKVLNLTPKEFQLLHLFAANPGRAFSREFLIERVWNGDFEGYDRAVDTHVTRLRRKLGRLGDQVQTVWGVGYRFTRPEK
jgi:DNA-binding response OmpR family regulator